MTTPPIIWSVEVLPETEGERSVYYVPADTAEDACVIAFAIDGGYGNVGDSIESALMMRKPAASYCKATPPKVYGWNHGYRERRIVAAPSLTAVSRLSGVSRSRLTKDGSWTMNAEELALAGGQPGTVFAKSCSSRCREWRRAE